MNFNSNGNPQKRAKKMVNQRDSDGKRAGALDSGQLLNRPGHELSKLIKQGHLTSTKLCELYIERIKQVQPAINAMCEDRFEAALQDAAAIDELVARHRANSSQPDEARQSFSAGEIEMLESPLLGIPVSVKECVAVKGMKNSCGLVDRRDFVAEDDAVVVKNVKRLGLIPICTTNVPEMTMFWADCNNKVYGRTHNPYDLSRVPGASSGGEGALLGAGASIVGIGTDIGGSLRNPAQYSGIMTHKPSPFLVSSEGNFPAVKEARLRMFTMGPMTRYASDLRYLLKILLSDKDNPKRDTYFIHQPAGIGNMRQNVIKQLDEGFDLSKVKFFYSNFKEVSKLKAILSLREPKVQPEIMDAQKDVIKHFGSKFNCQVEQLDLEKYLDQTFTAWVGMMFCGGTVDRDQAFEEREVEKIFGINNLKIEVLKLIFGMSKHTKESISTVLFGLPIPKDRVDAYKMCEKYELWVSEMRKELETTIGDFGCIVMPTLPTVAHKHGQALMRAGEARFSWFWNVAQCPVTHVTIRLDKAHGLPLGLALASKPGNDALTIAVAEEIERTFGGWTPSSIL
jgi:fatty acid amide hydrolase 2